MKIGPPVMPKTTSPTSTTKGSKVQAPEIGEQANSCRITAPTGRDIMTAFSETIPILEQILADLRNDNWPDCSVMPAPAQPQIFASFFDELLRALFADGALDVPLMLGLEAAISRHHRLALYCELYHIGRHSDDETQ